MLHIHLWIVVARFFLFLFNKSDILSYGYLEYIRESLRLRDNESILQWNLEISKSKGPNSFVWIIETLNDWGLKCIHIFKSVLQNDFELLRILNYWSLNYRGSTVYVKSLATSSHKATWKDQTDPLEGIAKKKKKKKKKNYEGGTEVEWGGVCGSINFAGTCTNSPP